MDENQIAQRLQQLDTRVSNVEGDYFGANPITNAQTVQNLNQAINLPYTTTVPTDTPAFNGVRRFYYDGSDYWIYIYANNAWRSIKMGGGTQAISRDSTSGNGNFQGATTFTVSHTCSGSGRLLVCAIQGHKVSSDIVTSVTYNGVAMLRTYALINTGGDESLWMYHMTNPNSGTHDIVITTSVGPDPGSLYVANASYNGCSQAGFPVHESDNALTAGGSIIVSTDTNNWFVGAISGGTTFTYTSTPSTVTRYSDQTLCAIIDSGTPVVGGGQTIGSLPAIHLNCIMTAVANLT